MFSGPIFYLLNLAIGLTSDIFRIDSKLVPVVGLGGGQW